MSKISDIVKLKTGYANFVELKSAFEAAQENADRMAMYRPTKHTVWHLNAFAEGFTSPTTRNSICLRRYISSQFQSSGAFRKRQLATGLVGTGWFRVCDIPSRYFDFRAASYPASTRQITGEVMGSWGRPLGSWGRPLVLQFTNYH